MRPWAASGPTSMRELVDKVVFTALRVAGMELHLATGAVILARASGHGQDGIAGIEEGPRDAQLAILQRQGPIAFPGLADDGANAPAIVLADKFLVVLVIDLVGESQEVADAVPFGTQIGDGIRRRPLDISGIFGLKGIRRPWGRGDGENCRDGRR